MSWPQSLTIHVHDEEGQDLWAEVDELPGCFATGRDLNELREALNEAVSLYLSEPGKRVNIRLEVVEEQALVHAAC